MISANKTTIKLFCIPYAGGLSSIYYGWREWVDPSIQLIPLELAGRGTCSHQPMYENMQAVVEDLFNRIRPQLDGTPFAIFGHSLGAMIAYELALYIKRQLGLDAQHIFFSGKSPLHLHVDEKRYSMSDTEFEKYIISLGGIPDALIDCRELLDIFLPIIRSDMKLVDSFSLNKNNIITLKSDISIYNGHSDHLVDKSTLEEWRLYSSGYIQFHHFSGGHFFINEYSKSVVNRINEMLSQYIYIH